MFDSYRMDGCSLYNENKRFIYIYIYIYNTWKWMPSWGVARRHFVQSNEKIRLPHVDNDKCSIVYTKRYIYIYIYTYRSSQIMPIEAEDKPWICPRSDNAAHTTVYISRFIYQLFSQSKRTSSRDRVLKRIAFILIIFIRIIFIRMKGCREFCLNRITAWDAIGFQECFSVLDRLWLKLVQLYIQSTLIRVCRDYDFIHI